MNESTTYPHFSPGKLLVGPGSSASLAQELPGKPVYLVVTDQGLGRAGVAARLTRILEQAGKRFHVFDGVAADPPIEVVASALEAARQNGCNAVLALGGGSSLDTAKALAVNMKHDVSLREYGDGRSVEGPISPLYAIPTTAGTGSEATRVAVITDAAKKEKMAIRGDHLTPLISALDPDMLVGIPARIAAETGIDALTHAIEAFVSRNANTVTDVLALGAIEKIGSHLRRFVQDTTDKAAALEMLVASCLAGQAFTNAGLGLVHSIGEVLGSRYHTSHGLSCALYLPATMAFNLPAAPERFEKIARALGEDVKDLAPEEGGRRAVAAVERLFESLNLPRTYTAVGVDFTLTSKMVEDILPQFSTQCNPRKADADQIAALFNAPMG